MPQPQRAGTQGKPASERWASCSARKATRRASATEGSRPAAGPLGKELLQRELLAVCVGDERDRAQAAAAAGGLAGKEDRVPTAQLRPCSGVVRQIRRLEAAHADEAGAGRAPLLRHRTTRDFQD